jgi:two-component system cell cycle sensor histidine kinase/response regulator CckA
MDPPEIRKHTPEFGVKYPVGSVSTLTRAASTPIRLLLVEDDDAYAAMLQAQLSGTSVPIVVERVSTLNSAITVISSTRFDAILLDLGLPDSVGLETVDRIHGVTNAVVPIVVLTSNDDDALGVQAVQRGAEDYLVKSSTDAPLLERSIRYARERAEWRREILARQAELRQAHKMEAVGRLAGGIAHDFNNMLTAIFGYVDLLLEQFTDDDPRREDVGEIRRSAERAASLTRQLLAFSRKQMMQPRVLNLNEVLASLHKLLARVAGEGIVFEIRPWDTLWQVRADPGQIEHVLMNLMANARDAMPEGGRLTIETANVLIETEERRARPGLRIGAYATLAVTDTGAGMPESVRAHIFEPFFTTKDIGEGTGLGLATVYGIIKQMGGGVYVESEEGKGTRVVIYLPRVP